MKIQNKLFLAYGLWFMVIWISLIVLSNVYIKDKLDVVYYEQLQVMFILFSFLMGVSFYVITLWITSFLSQSFVNSVHKVQQCMLDEDKNNTIPSDDDNDFLDLESILDTVIEQNSLDRSKFGLLSQYFYGILDNAGVIIYIKDLEGNYKIINQKGIEVYGKNQDSILDHNDKTLFGDTVSSVLWKNDQKVLSEAQSFQFDETIVISGKDYSFITTKFPIYDKSGTVCFLGAILIDITPIKESQDRMVGFSKNLEYEVTRRTSDLLMSNIELEKSLTELKETQERLIQSEKMASLGDLVAGISHEINTPIGLSITAITHLKELTKQLFRSYENDDISEKYFEEYLTDSLELIHSVSSNLYRSVDLIRSFKQVAVDQSSEEKRDFYLKEYIETVLMSLQYEIKHQNVICLVNCDDTLSILSYPGAIFQIITNCVMNSLVHGFKDIKQGVIRINVSKEANNVIIEYKDNGCGIKQEDIPKIFDPFFTTNREHGGSGLGLHITYNLVVMKLKGEIVCKSDLNKGAVFTICLPQNIIPNEI